jgi:t-SNARE complex subunit (syntaxin)
MTAHLKFDKVQEIHNNFNDLVALKNESDEIADVAQRQLKEFTEEFETATANMKKRHAEQIQSRDCTIKGLSIALICMTGCVLFLAIKLFTKN